MRYYRHVLPGGGPGADRGLNGEIAFLSCLGNVPQDELEEVGEGSLSFSAQSAPTNPNLDK